MSWQIYDFGASGTTLIDGANIYTGSILGTSIKANEITGNHIKAGAITTSHLSFTPVQSNNVVATINASTEGIKINAAKLTLTGLLQVGGAAADINAGATTIDGGKITADSLDATKIKAASITTDKLAVGTVTRQNLITNGHFGSYNTFGDSAQGWTLASGVTTATTFSYTPKTSAGTDGSALGVIALTKAVVAGIDTVFTHQDVTVIPGRTYTVVGLLYAGNSQTSGTVYLRTLAMPSGTRLSSDTSGVSSGEIVPPFYQNATRIVSARDSYPVGIGWKLITYRVTIPNGCTRIRIEVGGSFGTTGTAVLYPAFIQAYDDDTIEATSSLDMVNQLQNVAFGGDLQGNYLTATVRSLRGRLIQDIAPSHAQILGWHSTNNQWQPLSISSWLGYTPLKNTSDTLSGILTVDGGAGSGTFLLKGAGSYPQIAFNIGADSRLLFRAGNNLRWRYDGTNDGDLLHTGNFVAGTHYLSPTGSGAGLTGTANSLSVASAAMLTTARTINGVSFNGSANITVTTAGTGIGVSGTAVSIASKYSPNTSEWIGGAPTDLNTLLTPGFYYETTNANAAKGSNFPATQAGSLLVMRHAGYTQVYFNYANSAPRAWFRNNDSGTWGSWMEFVHSGNISSQSVANATTAGGKAPSNAVGINTLVTRDENGYSYFNYINSNTGNSENPAISQVIVTNGGDHFYRKASLAHLVASMDLSGKTAGNATTFNGNTSASAMLGRGSVAEASIDTATSNGFYNVTRTSDSVSLLTWNTAGSTGPVQLWTEYNGTFKFRNKTDSSSWTAWKSIWHSGNFDPNTKLDTSGGTIANSLTVGTGGTHLYLDSSCGVAIYTASSGGWSRGLVYRKYTDGTHLAGWGAMGGLDSVSYLWAGADYNNNWLELTSTYAKVSGAVRLVDSSTELSKGDGNSLKITTPTGNLHIGSQNAGTMHFITDSGAYYFNKLVKVDGDLLRYNTNTGMTSVGFQTQSGNGQGYRFWSGSDGYSITMNDYNGAMGAGGYNTGGADYNMSFRMDGYDAHRGGTDNVARGFLFRNHSVGTSPYAQLAPLGGYSYWGGILIMRDTGNNNLYGIYFNNGVLYAKQMA